MEHGEFERLLAFLSRVPGIDPSFGKGKGEDGLWWVKFQIDVEHKLAWNVVQEIGYIVNYLSPERLPTVFYPASPPPYLNGGPKLFLSWVIESESNEFTPDHLSEWLEGGLPKPVEDLAEWPLDED